MVWAARGPSPTSLAVLGQTRARQSFGGGQAKEAGAAAARAVEGVSECAPHPAHAYLTHARVHVRVTGAATRTSPCSVFNAACGRVAAVQQAASRSAGIKKIKQRNRGKRRSSAQRRHPAMGADLRLAVDEASVSFESSGAREWVSRLRLHCAAARALSRSRWSS